MKKQGLLIAGALLAAGSAAFLFNTNKQPAKSVTIESKQDSVLLSFAFVGCNRVQRGDTNNKAATNASSANLSALKRIYSDLLQLKQKPSLFFFLGDLVCAEANTEFLNSQLKGWCNLYNDTSFSKISQSGIEMVALPGNHEMLYYNNVGVKGHDEWPLKGATEVWMQYMAPFMPKDRDVITGPDSLVNQMTYSFVRQNTAFIVMNTDTYNPPTPTNPYGLEGQIPAAWIVNKIKFYRNNPAIKHILVLGHKPYYVNGQPTTGHDGLPQGDTLWTAFKTHTVAAMLSAHVHDYQRMQPGQQGPYQIIAGHGGSLGSTTFYGYTIINIMSSGQLKLESKGFDIGNPYYANVPANPFKVRDTTVLSWGKNANPYNGY